MLWGHPGGRPLRRVLASSFAAIALLVGVLVGLTAVTLSAQLAWFAPRLRADMEAAEAIRRTHEGMLDQEIGVRGYLLSGPAEAFSYLEPYQEGQEEFSSGLGDALRVLSADPALRELLDEVEDSARTWQTEWAQPVVADRTTALAAPGVQPVLARGKALFNTYRRAERRLVGALDQRTQRTLAAQSVSYALGLVVSLGFALVVLGGVWWQRRRLGAVMVEPLLELAAAVSRSASLRLDPEDPGLVAHGATPPLELAGLRDEVRWLVSVLKRREDELRELSIRDPLTGLLNRRRLTEDLDREVLVASRSGQPCGLVMIDVDHFKQLNDRLGHQGGDEVLRHVATSLARSVRGSDSVYRFGGEEFVVLARATAASGARELAERIRRAVAEQLDAEGITVSCGVAALPADAQTATRLLAAADRAVYTAKDRGRNRVVVASEAAAGLADGSVAVGTAG